jgi:hypothetical protein
LNIVHLSIIHIEHCSNSAEANEMQTLIVQVATTFMSDAAALVNGFGRIATHIVMAPIERIANACDVAGILPKRRATLAAQRTENRRVKTGFVWRSFGHGMRRGRRPHRRGGGFGCLRFLSDLT